MSPTHNARFSLVDLATLVVLLLAIFVVSLPGGALYNPVHSWIVHRRMTAAVRQQWPELSKMALPLYVGSEPPAVIEFTDYQCPFCRAAEAVVDSALRDGVRLAVIQLPLSIHPRAHAASLAAQCGAIAGEFASVHHFLMNHSEWMASTEASIVPRVVHLDRVRFLACEHDNQTQAMVDRQVAAAKSLGIAGTPMFVYSGGVLDKPLTAMNLRQLGMPDGN